MGTLDINNPYTDSLATYDASTAQMQNQLLDGVFMAGSQGSLGGKNVMKPQSGVLPIPQAGGQDHSASGGLLSSIGDFFTGDQPQKKQSMDMSGMSVQDQALYTQTQYTKGLMDQQNSAWTQGMNKFSQGVQGLSTLANVYLGFKQMGIAEDQLDMAKETHAAARKEREHVGKMRKRITASYM